MELGQLTAEECEHVEKHISRITGIGEGLHVWAFEMKASTIDPYGHLEHCVPLYMRAHYFPDFVMDGYIEDFVRHIDEFTDTQALEIITKAYDEISTKKAEIEEAVKLNKQQENV